MNWSQIQMVFGLALVLAAAIILLAASDGTIVTGLAIALAILGIGLIATSRIRRM